MGKHKLYIGFSIDMDAPDKIEEFRSGCKNIIDFFNSINYLNSCTWLLNHNKAYDTLSLHEELIKDIYNVVKKENGCIGLHTHFNSYCFNPPDEFKCPKIQGVTRGGWTKMQKKKDYWYDSGLKTPKKEIEDFIKKHYNDNYTIECFKSGNHMRNKVMFESLTELGFKYDCTCGYEIKREYSDPDTNKLYTVYDDNNTLIKDGPFFINNKNGKILEIPETPTLSKIKNVNFNKNFYYLYQLHPDEVSGPWDKKNPKDKRNIIINNIYKLKRKFKNHDIISANMKEMGQNIISSNDFFQKHIDTFC